MTDHETATSGNAPTGDETPASGETPTDPDTILVTGATGNTGSRLVPRLAALGHPVRAAGRRAPELPGAQGVAFDWYDPATHDAALRGAARLYLVPPTAAPDPAAVMLPFLERARSAGVRRVALLSSSAIPAGGPGVGQVHAALPDLFDAWAVLRPSWFMQNFTDRHPHAESIRTSGVLLTATGAGRVGFIDADDIAAVAAHALTDEPPLRGADLVLTGPQSLNYDDIAATLTALDGRPVRTAPSPTTSCTTAWRPICPRASPACWPAWTAPSPTVPRTGSRTPSSASPAGRRAASATSRRPGGAVEGVAPQPAAPRRMGLPGLPGRTRSTRLTRRAGYAGCAGWAWFTRRLLSTRRAFFAGCTVLTGCAAFTG